jgi:acyl dehydratase
VCRRRWRIRCSCATWRSQSNEPSGRVLGNLFYRGLAARPVHLGTTLRTTTRVVANRASSSGKQARGMVLLQVTAADAEGQVVLDTTAAHAREKIPRRRATTYGRPLSVRRSATSTS